eukprot:15479365-Alexandrium_andersonii.AAC.1
MLRVDSTRCSLVFPVPYRASSGHYYRANVVARCSSHPDYTPLPLAPALEHGNNDECPSMLALCRRSEILPCKSADQDNLGHE